jgi:hypothetical protein
MPTDFAELAVVTSQPSSNIWQHGGVTIFPTIPGIFPAAKTALPGETRV